MGTKPFRVYLDPKEPTFSGFLIMVSENKSKKRSLFGVKVGFSVSALSFPPTWLGQAVREEE